MDLDCFVFDGWRPRLRRARRHRDWMDATPDRFAYRCLPLAMANVHGWEAAAGCGFAARWLGGSDAREVEIILDDPATPEIDRPVALFGQGVLTFHIQGLFRTPPGWGLWIGGPANVIKDGVAPLAGLIETDWSPYSFTMNWRFTRPGHWVRFERDEAICAFFPVQNTVLTEIQPRIRPIEDAPDLKQQFEAWSQSRNAFQQRVRDHPPASSADAWQKLYYRGLLPDGVPAGTPHQTKLHLAEFEPDS